MSTAELLRAGLSAGAVVTYHLLAEGGPQTLAQLADVSGRTHRGIENWTAELQAANVAGVIGTVPTGARPATLWAALVEANVREAV